MRVQTLNNLSSERVDRVGVPRGIFQSSAGLAPVWTGCILPTFRLPAAGCHRGLQETDRQCDPAVRVVSGLLHGQSWKAGHLVVAGLVFLACTIVFVAGRYLHAPAGTESRYLPPLLTGFEAGMMGYAIFTAVYGVDNVFNFAVVDLGQVIFVFFVLVPFVQRQGSGATSIARTCAWVHLQRR